MSGFTVDVRFYIADAIKGLDLLQKDVNRAAVAALNKTATTSRAVAARQISAASSLPVNEVRKRVPLIRANKFTMEAVIKAERYAPNLIRYAARQTKQGVSAKAWGVRKVYRGTFIGNKGKLTKSGKGAVGTVFIREGRNRLPIKAVYGPSVPREFVREKTIAAIQSTVKTRFPLEYARALQALQRWK